VTVADELLLLGLDEAVNVSAGDECTSRPLLIDIFIEIKQK
jgi:hypothetical protein